MAESIKIFQLAISLLALISTTSIHQVQSQGFRIPQTLFFGAIFQEGDIAIPLQHAFKHAIHHVNKDRTVLGNTRLVEKSAHVTPSNSFKASRKVCELFGKGIVALFAPSLSPSTLNHIRSTSTALSVPLMETGFEYLWTRPEYSINVSPHPWSIGTAIANLIKTLNWKQFVIVYENEESLVRLQEVAKLPKGFDSELRVSFRQLNTDSSDYRPLLKQIKEEGIMRIVLDCSFEKIESVLEQALEIGMITDYHSYIINSLDMERVNLFPFKHSDVNITSFRLVDPDSPRAREYLKDWTPEVFGRGRNHPLFSANVMIYDAVWAMAKAIDELGTMKQINVEPVSCKDGAQKRQNSLGKKSADEILKRLLDSYYEGLSGEINLDKEATAEFRSDVKLDLLEKNSDRMEKTGTWTLAGGVNYTQSEEARQEQTAQKLQNKTLRVVTVPSKPYIMKTKKFDEMEEEERAKAAFSTLYEGYVVDLIKALSKQVKFKYEMYIVADGNYGALNEQTGKWNGMIADLINHEADLSCVDMSITSQRQKAVDFAMPYMNTGIGILYKKKKPPPPNLFSFMAPLSVDVWIYMITAYLLSSILMFLLGRLSPLEWESAHPCESDPSELENGLNLLNCLWHNIGALMQQGSDLAPKSISCRTVASIWWFFTLIMISSYTANLAAFLTAAKMDSPVNNADDLAKQTKIKYGSKSGGSTYKFFKDSTIPSYAKLNAFMESAKPSVYTKGNQEGMDRVMKEDGAYAFFMEEAALKYYMARNCDLTQIGGLLDNKGYGIGLPLESPYTKIISDGVLKLQEDGILTQLRNKWWNQKYVPEEACGSEEGNSAQLGLANLGGVFIVLLGGVIVSCLLALCEYMWEARRLVQDKERSAWVEFSKELRFAIDCTAGDSKPNPDKEGPTSASRSTSKGGSKSLLDDHSHPYGIIEDKERDSAYAQFNESVSAK